jgi:glutamine synthetase
LSQQILENFIDHQHKILKNSWIFALQELALFCDCKIIKIGCELEFYLLDQNLEIANSSLVDNFIFELKKINFLLEICEVKKECGQSQIEIATIVYDDLEKLCEDLDCIKKLIFEISQKLNSSPSFKGQVVDNDCGNSLQFNISLSDSLTKNIFFKNSKLINLFSSLLLDYTDEMLYLLAPNPDDYRRFDSKINKKLFDLGKFCAPINLSFGNDNRSCAIRIPKCDNKQNTRIEYRIASASTNHWLGLSAILIALAQVKHQKNLYPQIFGNAFDEIYDIKNFIKNFQLAKEKFLNNENIIFNYFKDIINN